MWTRFRQLLAPPEFEDDQGKTNAAGLLNSLLITVFVGTLAFPIALVLFRFNPDAIVVNVIIGLSVVTLGLWIILRLGYIQFVSISLPVILWAGFTIPIFQYGGMHDTAVTGFFLVIILTSAIANWQTVFFISALNILTVVAVYIAENIGLIDASFSGPSEFDDLALLIILLGFSGLLLRTVILRLRSSYESAQKNARALNQLNTVLEENQIELETQAQALKRRSRFLETTAKISHEVVSELDLDSLLTKVSQLISEQFNFYHTGIFLIDTDSKWAELKAASSEDGQRMLARGHRLRVGEEGIIGFVTSTGQPRVALDVRGDSFYYDNPDMPTTRSEAAWPLQARGEIIGALDVQSQHSNAFTEEDAATLQILADQVAMAINNAQLFTQAQKSIAAERVAYGVLSRQAWTEMVQSKRITGYRYADGDVQSIPDAADEKNLDNLPELKYPVRIRGQEIGTLCAHKSEDSTEWTPDEIQLIETLINQLDIAMESARLYQDTQRRAVQEQLSREITEKMRRATSAEGIIQTAVNELYQALGESPRVYAELDVTPQQSSIGDLVTKDIEEREDGR